MLVGFIIQIFMIHTFVLLYFAVKSLHRALRRRKVILFTLFTSIIIILCMSFPVSHSSGLLMDLRTVPWMASFLYGGFGVGIMTTAIMVIYQFLLGGKGLTIFFSAYTVMIVILFFTYKKYIYKRYSTKLIYSSGIILLHSLLVILFVHISNRLSFSKESLLFDVSYIIYPVITNWLIIFLIETMRHNETLGVEIAQSEKIHIVGQLAASVAHEVRNPITVIKGFMQLLRSDRKISDEKYQHYLQTMELELERATSIINDYLSLAKPQDYRIERIHVNEQMTFVKDILKSYALLTGVTIRYNEKKDYFIKGSKEKFQQVLLNIMKNGIEASNKESDIELSTQLQDHFVLIKIRDFGQGMTPDQIDRAGMPFYTTKETGTGLGLMVCYQIIENMAGKIHIESEPGMGTCFTITLPSEI